MRKFSYFSEYKSVSGVGMTYISLLDVKLRSPEGEKGHVFIFQMLLRNFLPNCVVPKRWEVGVFA